jgi:hypothetical protein
MEKGILLAFLTTLVFFVFRILEMKYIDKEWMPMKYVVRDIFIVFIAALTGTFAYFHMELGLLEFFSVVTDNGEIAPIATQIFTDEPGF